MNKVIIYKNDSGGVSVVYPTGELPIDEVLKRDCPTDAQIYDQNRLPESEADFFDAWELNDGAVTVNLIKARKITTDRINNLARVSAGHRRDNTAIGLDNAISDTEFTDMLVNIRADVNAADSLDQLRAVDFGKISHQ
jgi:hypothetical protein